MNMNETLRNSTNIYANRRTWGVVGDSATASCFARAVSTPMHPEDLAQLGDQEDEPGQAPVVTLFHNLVLGRTDRSRGGGENLKE